MTKNASFIFHVFITLLAWPAPFLVSWYFLLPIYLGIYIQFRFIGKCVLNESHGLVENGEDTIYSDMAALVGIKVNKKRLHIFVRHFLYLLLSAFTLLWQQVLGYEPLWF